MTIDAHLLKRVTEAAILASGKPLTIVNIQALFEFDDEPSERPSKAAVEAALAEIQSELSERGFELKEVATGWRFQVRQDLSPWVGRLWDEKPQKYSRALLETLSLIAYRQPITRGEIEEIRGVAVSSHIVKTLSERHWVKVIGHKDVPGRPAMYATTKEFLDYFNMSSLEDLPTLAEIRDLDSMNKQLNLEGVDTGVSGSDEFGLNDKLEGMSEEKISQLAAEEVNEENRQAQERLLTASMDDDLFDGVEVEAITETLEAPNNELEQKLTSPVEIHHLDAHTEKPKITDLKDLLLSKPSVDAPALVEPLSETKISAQMLHASLTAEPSDISSNEQAELEQAEKEEKLAQALEAEMEAELEAAMADEQEERESEDL